jgi:ABC-type lipoprotein release transport system permease subunit
MAIQDRSEPRWVISRCAYLEVVVIAAVIGVGVIATVIPARRAARIEPVTVLQG